MTNAEFNQQLQERILNFAVRTFKFMKTIPNVDGKRVVTYQLSKSCTSVGANFRAFCRGRSKNEKFAKICIVTEEVDESEYWLTFIKRMEWGEKQELDVLLKEVDELIRIIVSIKNSLYPSRKK